MIKMIVTVCKVFMWEGQLKRKVSLRAVPIFIYETVLILLNHTHCGMLGKQIMTEPGW